LEKKKKYGGRIVYQFGEKGLESTHTILRKKSPCLTEGNRLKQGKPQGKMTYITPLGKKTAQIS